MASAIDLTSLSGCRDIVLDNDEVGLRVLLGGIDGRMVNTWALEPNASRQLAYKRFCQLTADHAIEAVWERPDSLDLFDRLDLRSIDPSHEKFESILSSLHLRVLGEEMSSEEFELHKHMFSQIAESHSAKQAWKSMLSVLLRIQKPGVPIVFLETIIKGAFGALEP